MGHRHVERALRFRDIMHAVTQPAIGEAMLAHIETVAFAAEQIVGGYLEILDLDLGMAAVQHVVMRPFDRHVGDIALVMAKTDPDAPRHQQFSTFLVELPNPGYKIKRNIKTMGIEGPLSHILGGGHAEIEISNLEVPADNILGGVGNGFNMGQHRLAYGRLRHGMHNVAKAQRALDMAVAHVTKRSTFGTLLADRQAVQFMLAECATQLYIGRLMLLHIAYKAEKGMDLRQENSIAKVYLAHMVHHVIDTAIQLHGALGFSQDTPLAKWYTQVRSQRLVDGPDEVHRWRVGRNVIKAFREHGTTASATGGDLL